MLKTRVIPCLLLRDWGIEKSIRFQDFVYVGSPINAVRMFNAYMCDELILLDIAATAEGRCVRPEVLTPIADEATMPLAVGGGIRRLEDVPPLMDAGADRVVVNTAAIDNPSLITEIADRYGSQCVIVSIDARRSERGGYEVFSAGGKKGTGKSPSDWAKMAEEKGAGEILINSIDRDGTMEGYDLDLFRSVTSAVGVPVIGLGGAASLADMRRGVDEAGLSAVAAGAYFLFFGRRRTVLITYPTHDELEAAFPAARIRPREQLIPWHNPIKI